MIGIIGSGLDSMLMTKAFLHKNPGRDVLCFGDNRRFFPESADNPDDFIQIAVKNAMDLADSGADLILIASHTLSCIAGDEIAASVHVPVRDILTPSVKLAGERSRYGRIGIIGSRAVIDSGCYSEKIGTFFPKAKVYGATTSLLLPLIAEGWLTSPMTAMIIKKYLIPLKTRQIDTLILASTPYALLSAVIQRKIGIQVRIIDGTLALAEAAAAYLNTHPDVAPQIRQKGRLEVILTQPSPFLERQARNILNIRNAVTICGLQ